MDNLDNVKPHSTSVPTEVVLNVDNLTTEFQTPNGVGRAVDAFVFSPKEAEVWRHAQAPTHRRAGQKPNPTKTARTLGDRYTTDSYCRAIRRGCKAASVPRWTPLQLRHTAATALRREYGIDVAQTILGHQMGSAITEVYAEANQARAQDVIAKIG